MLGFSPLASAPLGDDGVTADIVHVLNGVSITTGQPSVGPTNLTQTDVLSVVGITTGLPTVGSPTLVEGVVYGATSILTGLPTLSTPDIVQSVVYGATSILTGVPTLGTSDLTTTYIFNGVSLLTGNPVVPSIAFDPPQRRVAPISGNANNPVLNTSRNTAILTDGYNKVA
jgi:hypothetical protein